MAKKWQIQVHRATDSTTLDEIYPSQSFAADETFRIGNVISSSLIAGNGPYARRALVKFGTWDSQSNFAYCTIRLRAAHAEWRDFNIASINVGFYSMSSGQTFVNGRGRRDSVPATNKGSTWAHRNAPNNEWALEPTQSNATHRTLFTVSESGDLEGDLSLSYGQSSYFTGQMDHISIWNSMDHFENLGTDFGTIEYYSAETHTIYQPELWFYKLNGVPNWPDGVSVDGTLDLSDEFVIYNKNLKSSYNYKNVPTFRIGCRPRYMKETYGTSSSPPTVYYLPSGSTYNFKDVASGDYVIPNTLESSSNWSGALEFDADSSGHYITDLPDNLFFPERLYQVVVNVRSASYYETFVLPETFKFEF